MKLLELRKTKGVNQQEVADYIGVDRSTYTRYERGNTNPDPDTLKKLAEYFSVSVDFLLGLDDTPNRETKFRWIPLRDGLPAGPLSETDSFIIGYVEVPSDRYPGMELAAVKVKGDSMEPRIMEGDIVIFRPQNYANNGDTVIVRINGNEYTLKKFKKLDNGIMLIPNNQPKYEPLFFSFEQVETLPVEIIGVVVELRSQF